MGLVKFLLLAVVLYLGQSYYLTSASHKGRIVTPFFLKLPFPL